VAPCSPPCRSRRAESGQAIRLRRIRKLADQGPRRLNPTFCDLFMRGKAGPRCRPQQLRGWPRCLQAFTDSIGALLWRQAPLHLLFRYFAGL